MTPSAKQIAAAMQRLDSATLRGRLASGELTETGRALAQELLRQREQEGNEEPAVASESLPVAPLENAILEFGRRPFGWSWGNWVVAILLCVMVVASFGTHARQRTDQTFLYGVIFLQSLLLAGILRAVSSIFTSSLSLGLLGKIIAVGLLCYVIGLLTICSTLAQSGWGGG